MTSLLRSMLSVSAATVLSRATGYLRWGVQAAVIATTFAGQAYAVAILLPNLIYELFLGGIMYSIFIPVLVERMTTHGEEDARRLTNVLLTLVLPLMALLALAGILLAGPLVGLVTSWGGTTGAVSPEEARQTRELAVLFFRVFSVQMVFFGVSTIATGVLQAHRRFFLPTFAPVLNNLVVIASFVGYGLLVEDNRTLAVYLLAVGTTLGTAVIALTLVPAMRGLGYKPRPRLRHPALAPTARLAGPMVVLVAASVGFQFLAASFATDYGALAQLGYAFTIFSLPYGVFVVAVTTALMPELSEKHSRGDVEGYRDTFSFGLRTMLFVVIPSTVGMITLSEPLVGLLYQRLKFTAEDTRFVAVLLVAYAVGLLGYSTYFFLVRAFYARQNTKTPALLNVGILLAYAALAYGLSELFGAVGVVLALSAAYAVLAVLGLAATRRDVGRIDGRRLLLSSARLLAAGAVMYAVAWGGTRLFGETPGAAERLLVILTVGSTSLAAYLAAAFVLRAEELRSALTLIKRRTGGTAGKGP